MDMNLMIKLIPFEAGIGFTVPLKTKEDDFIGKEELIKRKANPQKKLVGLELVGHEPAVNGDCVHVGTSANWSNNKWNVIT
jgi:aminomethyltransferase